MSQARFTVEFLGDAPLNLQPGDELKINGVVTVHGISAPLVDVSDFLHRTIYVPGETTVELYSNDLDVERL